MHLKLLQFEADLLLQGGRQSKTCHIMAQGGNNERMMLNSHAADDKDHSDQQYQVDIEEDDDNTHDVDSHCGM